jgi:N-acetylmuramic acid 6-phosphate etherase
MVIGLICGGDAAMRRAVENAEDNPHQAWEDLMSHHIDKKDFVLGIAASGTTPYVIGGLQKCQQMGISTGAICCNAHSPVAQYADFPIEAVVGPEFVTGSTRMKAGTAQKLILNMISTTVMIQLGRVRGNRMVDMKLSNQKLIDRGTQMVMLETPWDYPTARAALLEKGSVRLAIDKWKNKE